MKTKIGGQAVLEGVMMRGATCQALAVRDENGNINTENKGTMITDAKGDQVFANAKAVYVKGYWDYVNAYCKDYWYLYGNESTGN